jgi:classical protein kinase C
MQFNNREDPFADINSAEQQESPLLKTQKKEKAVKPKITDFDIMEVVGIGNFGKVHKAFNNKAQRICALKVLKKENVAAMKHVDHIINEREVLQYLSDRNR